MKRKANQHKPLQDRAQSSLFVDLVKRTAEPVSDQGCWVWTGRTKQGYPSFNVRIDGRHRTIKPHRAMLVLCELEGEDEHFAQVYLLYSLSKLHADHHCHRNPLCINPDHLQWLTPKENSEKRWRQPNAGAT